jgi:hypothetical protein
MLSLVKITIQSMNNELKTRLQFKLSTNRSKLYFIFLSLQLGRPWQSLMKSRIKIKARVLVFKAGAGLSSG